MTDPTLKSDCLDLIELNRIVYAIYGTHSHELREFVSELKEKIRDFTFEEKIIAISIIRTFIKDFIENKLSSYFVKFVDDCDEGF